MVSTIYELTEGDPRMRKVAIYTLPPKQALIAYIEQRLYNNFNTSEYPDDFEGIRESSTISNHFYFDKKKCVYGGYESVFASYPENSIATPHKMRVA